MPRRIIYIQNPSEGSHFRTIDGGGGSSGGSRSPRRGKGVPYTPTPYTPSIPPGTVALTGGAIYAGTPSGWGNYGNVQNPVYPGMSVGGTGGMYEQQYSEDESDAAYGNIFLDILSGIDPFSGDTISPYGTPGTLQVIEFGNNIVFGSELTPPPASFRRRAYKRPRKIQKPFTPEDIARALGIDPSEAGILYPYLPPTLRGEGQLIDSLPPDFFHWRE